MSKIFKDAAAALFDFKSKSSLMSGGFGLCGIAENCIDAISKMNVTDLCVISNNIGNSGKGLVKLLKQNKIKEAYCSYVGGNPDLEERILNNTIKVNLIPQGSFAEKIRAGGVGIRAFYTPTGFGTEIAKDKEVKNFDKPCILEYALKADFTIIKAELGDPYGNLWFKESARSFSPLMAMAGKITIVEVEKMVQLGDIPAEDVHVPGVFVQRIFQGKNYQNHIEFLKVE